MGFISKSGTTIELVAKLTPEGRRKLITNTNSLVTYFSLGDSDNSYDVFSGLTKGEIPQISGDNNDKDLNNGGINYFIKSQLLYKPNILNKPVEVASISVNTVIQDLGQVTGQTITADEIMIDLNQRNSDTKVNLFYAFSLPMNDTDFNKFTGTTSQFGGFSDTAIQGLAQENILVIPIYGTDYSELIDGKSIKVEMTVSGTPYELYSTFEKKSIALGNEDMNVRDESLNLAQFGPNVALLFSDEIQTPNSGATTSWGTGYGQIKPFSINNKQRFNFKDNPIVGTNVDKAVGICYLDKGFIVITDPVIVTNFDSGSIKYTYNHIRNRVSQSITCIANRGEFTMSNNPTWRIGDIPRITEIGLWDNTNTLIAIGKLDKTYYKTSDDFVAFNLTIDF